MMNKKTQSVAAHFPSQGGFRKASLWATLGLSAAVIHASADNFNDSLKVDGTPLGGGVPSAIAHTNSPESIVAPGFSLQLVSQGIELLENPSGIITRFGFLNDASTTKTEPDENLYLVLDHNPGGPT